MRKKALKIYSKDTLITQFALEHRQVYIFKKHEAKLKFLTSSLGAENGTQLQAYLHDVTQLAFPHDLFRDEQTRDKKNNETEILTSSNTPIQRSSQVTFETLPYVTSPKQNTANDLATFGLFLANRNVERHPMVEEFMLHCDGATIAVEVSLYLTNEEVAYFKNIGFYLPLKSLEKPITGHIDVLQIRKGLIHLLDYKPDAKKLNPANQLLLYSLALASRTRLPLKLFVCAWFDEKDYFQFYPLHAVHKKT